MNSPVNVPGGGNESAATPITEAVVTLTEASHVYDMQDKVQTVERVQLGDQVLTEGVDYVVVNNRAVSPGTHKLIVLGIGSYTGAVSKNWTIEGDPTVARKVTYGTTDLKDGTSPLADGEVYLVYE